MSYQKKDTASSSDTEAQEVQADSSFNPDWTEPTGDDDGNKGTLHTGDGDLVKEKDVAAPASTGFSASWSRALQRLHGPVKRVLHAIVHSAATHPKLCIVGMLSLALILIVVGLFTNFNVDVDGDNQWTPFRSKPVSHSSWIEDDSGFPDSPGAVLLAFHRTGGNVLSLEGVRRVFEATDAVLSTPGFESVCTRSENQAEDGTFPCVVEGVVSFWNDSASIFEAEISSDEEAIQAMSAEFYPDGTSVDRTSIMGNIESTNNGTLLTSAQLYTVLMPIADNDDGANFEADALDVLLDIRDAWNGEAGNDFVLEVQATRSFGDEFSRAILNDIPLIPLVFIVMSVFTALVFFKRDNVKSRMLVGFGAVVSVLLSIMSGYGLLFLIGVPFTSMTQILPFIMFGIGLDDAFIISVAYEHTDKNKDPVDRIHDTIEEVGVSITLTTLTSTLAFGLGAISTIPTVYWLCLYAFPTIMFDFLFQLTFFVAILVIDERRIQDNRRDCLVCVTAAQRDNDNDPEEEDESDLPVSHRFMTWYSKQLLRPWVKAVVIVAFIGLLVGMIFSTTNLQQEFEATDVLPDDSYVSDYFAATDDYATELGIAPEVYFRFAHQSDPAIQAQMEAYIDDLVALEEIESPPTRFWLWDFRAYLNTTEGADVADKPFRDQIQAFLSNPVYKELYNDNIVLDSNGDVSASRTRIIMNKVDLSDVRDQVDALENQRRVTKNQPINKGKSDWSFFTYDGIYNIWEFYSVSVDELILTTIFGVVAVSVVAFVLIPHWSAVLIVFPMVIILYIDLLGFMQICGVSINVVSYIALVMSIGIMVDFIIHPLLRYFEETGVDRTEKVVKMLQTMGASVLIGGCSTFLGVMPLAFSSSTIFFTIFIAFLGLVLMGMLHGLVLLPVVLSIVGTNDVLPKAENSMPYAGSSN